MKEASLPPSNGLPPCPHTGRPLQRQSRTGADFAWSEEGALYSLRAAPLSYEEDYFLADYQNSYGKSYEEDEPNLRRMARSRLDFLKSRGNAGSGRLFEIGCATGFFLDEARSAGYDVEGIEISHWACRVAEQRFALSVRCGSFMDPDPDVISTTPGATVLYDVVAAFYVIEHFADQKQVFARIASLLKPGGLFLCALPSTHGPLLRCNPACWMETHPADHYVDYSPASLRKILPLYGMEAVRFRPASFHQERSCGWMRRLPAPAYRALARMTGFGDTLEFIARKM